MKQIFYGPSGYGKSHLILHNLFAQNRLIVISTNGLDFEFQNIGLDTAHITKIPLTMVNYADKCNPEYVVDDNIRINSSHQFNILGFDIGIPRRYHGSAIDAVATWLEKRGFAEDPTCTIIFINVDKKLQDYFFIKKITHWNANVIIEHCCSEKDCEYELEYIRKTTEWFERPILADRRRLPTVDDLALALTEKGHSDLAKALVDARDSAFKENPNL